MVEIDSPYETIDFKADPQTILTEHLTPKALERLDEMLDSPDLKIVEKAISKVQLMDKRLQSQAPVANVNVLNFDPTHLTRVFSGMKEMLSDDATRDISTTFEERKALPSVDGDGLD